MSTPDVPTEPLGVFRLIKDSLSLVFGNLGVLMPPALIASVLTVAVGYVIQGPLSLNAPAMMFDPAAAAAVQANVSTVDQVIQMAAGIVVWGFAGTAITRAAYDLQINGRASVNDALRTGAACLLRVLPAVIVFGLSVYAAIILLVLPGLYVMAMWFVIVPVVVVEQKGFSALGRSFALTRGYRWPMVGLALLFVLIYIAILALSFGFQYVFAGMGGVGLVLAAVSTSVMVALTYAISSTLAALAYARLSEVKEGASLNRIAEIFS